MRAAILVLMLTSISHAAAPPFRFPRFPLGKDTTFVNGPLDRMGYVDYAAALNARLGKGIKPDENAAVLLWKAFGPRPEGKIVPHDHFAAIGMKRPTIIGEYLVSLSEFGTKRLKLKPKEFEALNDEQRKASSRSWKAKKLPLMAAWLKLNETPLAVGIEASKRKRYFLALLPQVNKDGEKGDLIGCLLPSVQKCRELAALLSARAMLHAGEGRGDEAWTDLLACHRLGRLIGQGGTLIESLVGYAIESIASKATVAYLAKVKPETKALVRIAADLGKLPPMAVVADKVDLLERYTFLDCVQKMDQHGLRYLEGLSRGTDDGLPVRIPAALVDHAAAMRVGNVWYDRIRAALIAPTRKERMEELAAMERDLKAMKSGLVGKEAMLRLVVEGREGRGKHLGNILVNLLLPAVAKVQDATDRTKQAHDNLRLAIVLEAYHRANGEYPRDVKALVPKFLVAVPQDVFSGKGPIYKRAGKGYLLYSVGPNGKDDGGRTRDDKPVGDDVAVRMPPKE